ncbi:4140_t:CDS:2, partial [Gigaspora rosea]
QRRHQRQNSLATAKFTINNGNINNENIQEVEIEYTENGNNFKTYRKHDYKD